MKKLILLILSFALLSAMSACSQGEPTPNTEEGSASAETSAPETSPREESAYFFAVESAGGFNIRLNADMSEVLAALGEPLRYSESPSCAFEGLDKIYTYSGFTLTTRPEGGRDLIDMIALTDDSVTTPEGIFIGDSADAVKEAYGMPAEESELLLRYESNGTRLQFLLKNGEVTAIEYISM